MRPRALDYLACTTTMLLGAVLPVAAGTVFSDAFDRPPTAVTTHPLGGNYTDNPANVGPGWVAVRSGNCNWGNVPDAHLIANGKVEVSRYGGADWAKGAVSVTHTLADAKAQGVQADLWVMPWYWHTYHKPSLQSHTYFYLRMQDATSGVWVLTRINATKNAEKGDKPWLFAETAISYDGKWPTATTQIVRYPLGYAGAPKWPTHEQGEWWMTQDDDPDLGWVTCRQALEQHEGALMVHYTITKGAAKLADGWLPWTGNANMAFDTVGFGMDFDVNPGAKDDTDNSHGKALLDNFSAFSTATP